MSVLDDYVFASDDGYVLPLKVAVSSLLVSCRDMHWKDLVDFWKKLEGPKMLSIQRHVVDLSRLKDLPQWHGSVAPYARLLLPEILDSVSWCLYADCDTLFLRDPTVLEGTLDDRLLVIGHKNPSWCDALDLAWFKNHGYELDSSCYVCTGLIAINLQRLRQDGMQDRLFAFVKESNGGASADQTAINYVCRGAVGLLPFEWGAFNCEGKYPTLAPCIHYANQTPWGKVKTWRHYLGEDEIEDVWFRFAEEIGAGQCLRRRFRPWWREGWRLLLAMTYRFLKKTRNLSSPR